MPDLLPDASGGRTAPRVVPGAQAGDAADLTRLYELNLPALYVWIQSRVRGGLRLQVDAEDLLQEVWLRAVDGFARYDPARAAFRTWLIAIAKNVLLETMRHACASRSSGPLPDQSSILGKVPDSVTTLTRAVARKEDVQRMLAIIATLEEDDRSLVLGHGLEGLTLPEIAARLGVSSDAATKRWQRLIAHLRQPAVWSSVLGIA